ncbi:hypothetical protein [Shewanella sp. YIC-542]|uniref:hypothetical protein n=1 Tax=Shewanella mytili TaxID=3377111 RepID=UPI00398EB86F
MHYTMTLLLLLIAMPILANEQRETEIYMDWQSRYVSEGRDNLPRGGIVWSGIEQQRGAWHWYGRQGIGDSTRFVEINLGVQYQWQLPAGVMLTTGYKRAQIFAGSNSSNNELSAGLAYQGWHWLTPSLTYSYASKARGAFMEFSLTGHWQPTPLWLVAPYVTQGWDFGMASPSHDGPNHFQFGMETAYSLTTQLQLALQLHRSIGLDDITRQRPNADTEVHSNQNFGGLALRYRF